MGSKRLTSEWPEWVEITLRTGAYPFEGQIIPEPDAHTAKQFNQDDFEIVQHQILIDVTDTCNFNINTGIQRVVRNLVKELTEARLEFRLVTWNSRQEVFRSLTDNEFKVVTGFDITLGRDPILGLADPTEYKRLIPLECKIFIPELATQNLRVKRTAFIAGKTSNEVFAIGYDAVPILLPDTTSDGMVGAFTLQLDILKNCKKVFGISNSTCYEYSELFAGLRSQGLTGPKIVTVPLPIAPLNGESPPNKKTGNQLKFLVVGSHEPRKNHERILSAAELLWQKGHEFELHFVGSRGWNAPLFWELYSILKERNRHVYVHLDLADAELLSMYSICDVLLSFSLHEGYGLPIVEASTAGMRVIAAPHGSQGELGIATGASTSSGIEIFAISDSIESVLVNDDAAFKAKPELADQVLIVASWREYATKIFDEIKS